MSELENMTLLELRNFAKEQNIKNIFDNFQLYN